jgi:hypothetical protein
MPTVCADQTVIARIGTPTTWIYCPGPPSAAALLDAIRTGHVFISEAPRGPQLYLTVGPAMMGDSVARPADNRLALSVRVVDGAGQSLSCENAGRPASRSEFRSVFERTNYRRRMSRASSAAKMGRDTR